MNRINQSNLVFMVTNIVTIALSNSTELTHWMSQFLISLWVVIIGLFIFITSYLLKRLLKKYKVYLLLLTYLLTNIFITIFFAAISNREETFVTTLISFLMDKDVFTKLYIPYLLSGVVAVIFFKYRRVSTNKSYTIPR